MGLSGQWIDHIHGRRSLRSIVLDMDSSVSPTHGDQEGTAYNGHFACTCYHPLFVFNHSAPMPSSEPGRVLAFALFQGLISEMLAHRESSKNETDRQPPRLYRAAPRTRGSLYRRS
ncbi:MAG: hypothetical protein B7Y08_21165 [Rhodospirillales bacterium 24-66-33]|nr:MAG: hypothetical protein B7Y57_18570 [Rhodospirillales bacterium 35-66-84]OYZ92526.1 MAG: hypothetical protein B7Y08_21165 [Rhodospirillales bacterium 24-66-33]OZB23834.1 MAG: hypothetical protein B7X63_18030 [Rhodospirillales bacterium 39-66-50]